MRHHASGTYQPPPPRRLESAPPPDRGQVPLWADPRKEPPPGHRRFTSQTPLGGQSVGPGPTSLPVAAFSTRAGVLGIIRELTFDINNLLATSQVTMALRVNGGPVAGYTYRFFPFATPHVTVTFDVNTTYVELPRRSNVDVLVTVADGGTYITGVTIGGWDYPADLKFYGASR